MTELDSAKAALKKLRKELGQHEDSEESLSDPGFVARAIKYCLYKKNITPTTRIECEAAHKAIVDKHKL